MACDREVKNHEARWLGLGQADRDAGLKAGAYNGNGDG
jgi:hypothetical protein